MQNTGTLKVQSGKTSLFPTKKFVDCDMANLWYSCQIGRKIKYLFSCHDVEANSTAEWAKFSKEASFLAGVHGYTNRRRRRDAYEWGGGDDAVEDGEGAEDPVLPRRRAVDALPPPCDGRRQGRRRRRHRRTVRSERSFFFSKKKKGQGQHNTQKASSLSDLKSCARGGSSAATDGVDLYGAGRVATLRRFRRSATGGHRLGVRLCSVRATRATD